ncbi:hypothetical protein GJAV_G00158490 [Gymnothorax javanicus]|nr:hypothetical protein GJAV_G00158490 [Gymnothorax javanicus]
MQIKIEAGHFSGVDSIDCKIHNGAKAKIDLVKVLLGKQLFEVKGPQSLWYLIILILCIIPLIIAGVVCIYRSKQKKRSEQMNKRLTLLECEIRKEI